MDKYGSPKHSPHGSLSPNVGGIGVNNATDPAGLKVTISLKHKTPFYLMRPEPIPTNETTGATNLMVASGLEHSYMKLTTKKMKDSLSSFLPNMPGVIDTPGSQDNSSLRGVIEKPPVCGKELHPLNQLQLAGFRLHPGPLPEQYRGLTQMQARKKHKHKKHKHNRNNGVGGEATPVGPEESKGNEEEREKKREKKHKKHEKDAEERKKKKKEKKKKRSKEDKDG
ncbi:hypothetical protein TCAL_01378 [Tigriopus californicus]|uniref:Mediator of RNA polymerase II transcription subunit 19 n=1 Tax=Tigriopus californicus TaxID=6832 RepID=A0A553NUQ6_TIGCA|nr:mediator of RNA polymerase II transcription subunit 19-like [Tigriopus californicus]TRY69168.1 hypothetical protein TCAL_01378 [Tigriopus californicus]